MQAVDSIACEDTRHTLKLLTHFGIRKSLLSCHANDEERGVARILALLGEGKDVAFVSDAGTPGLSDPGSKAVRAARKAGHAAVPIPGASAFAALVSVAALPDKSILFEGFLSIKSGKRRSRLQELLAREEAFVIYESPHRVLKLLEELSDIDPGRLVVAGRELTKLHEEVLEGSATEVRDILAGRASILGEFAVAVSGKKKA